MSQHVDNLGVNEQGDGDTERSVTNRDNEASEHSRPETSRGTPSTSRSTTYSWQGESENAISSPNALVQASWRNLSVIFESSESFNSTNADSIHSKQEQCSRSSDVGSTTPNESILLSVPKPKRRYSLPSIASLSLSPRRLKSSELSVSPSSNVSQKVAYFENSVTSKRPSTTSNRSLSPLPSPLPSPLLESRRRSLPAVLDTRSFALSPKRGFSNESRSQENLQTGLLWYLHVNDASGPKWVRCRANLQQTSLQLSWTEPGHGRYSARLNLLECTAVQSTPTPSHASMAQDVGTTAWKRILLSTEASYEDIFPIFLIYSDGIERVATNTLRDRLNWVGSLWNVLNANQPEDSIPSVPSADSILRRTGSDFTQHVQPIQTNESTPTSHSLAVPRQINAHSRTRSTGDLPTGRWDRPSLSPKPLMRRISSLSNISLSSPNEVSISRMESAASSTISTPSRRHRTISLRSIASLITGLTSRADTPTLSEQSNPAMVATPSRLIPASDHVSGNSTPLLSNTTPDAQLPSSQKGKSHLLRLVHLRSHNHSNRSFSDSSIPTLTTTKRSSVSLSSSSTRTGQLPSESGRVTGAHSFHTAFEGNESSGDASNSAYFSLDGSTERAVPETPTDIPFVTASWFTSSDAWLSHLSLDGPSERKVSASSGQGMDTESTGFTPLIHQETTHLDALELAAENEAIGAGDLHSSTSMRSTSPYSNGRLTPSREQRDDPAMVRATSPIQAQDATIAINNFSILELDLSRQSQMFLDGNLPSSKESRQSSPGRSVYAADNLERNINPSETRTYSPTLDATSQLEERSGFRSVPARGSVYEAAMVSHRSFGDPPLSSGAPSSVLPLRPSSEGRGKRFRVVPKRAKEPSSNSPLRMSKSTISFPRIADAPSPAVEVSPTPVAASAILSRSDISTMRDEETTSPTKRTESDCEQKIKTLLEFIQTTRSSQLQASSDISNQLVRIEQQVLELAILVRCRNPPPPSSPPADEEPHIGYSRRQVVETSARAPPIREITPPTEAMAPELPTPTSFAFPSSLFAPTSLSTRTALNKSQVSSSSHNTSAINSCTRTKPTDSLHLSLFPDPPAHTPRVTSTSQARSDSEMGLGYEIHGLLNQLSNAVDEATRRQHKINDALREIKNRSDPYSIPLQAPNIALNDASHEQHQALSEMLGAVGELTDRVKIVFDKVTRNCQQKALSMSIESSCTPSPEVVYGKNVSFGAAGIAFAEQCAAPRAHSVFPPERSPAPHFERSPADDWESSCQKPSPSEGCTTSIPSVHSMTRSDQGRSNQGEPLAEQRSEDHETQPTGRDELIQQGNEPSGQLVIVNRERAITRPWHRKRVPSSRTRWQSQLDPLEEEKPPASMVEMEDIARLLEDARSHQDTAVVQQQEIVRYLSELNEWLARDVAGRQQGYRNLEYGLDSINGLIGFQEMHSAPTIPQPVVHPGFGPQPISGNSTVNGDDDTSTIVPPTPILMRPAPNIPVTARLPTDSQTSQGFPRTHEAAAFHAAPMTVQLPNMPVGAPYIDGGLRTTGPVTLDSVPQTELPPRTGGNSVMPALPSGTTGTPVGGDIRALAVSSNQVAQSTKPQVVTPTLPTVIVASPSDAAHSDKVQIVAIEGSEQMTGLHTSVKLPQPQVGNEGSALGTGLTWPILRSTLPSPKRRRVPISGLPIGRLARTEPSYELSSSVGRTSELLHGSLPSRFLHTQSANTSSPLPVAPSHEDTSHTPSNSNRLHIVKRKPVTYRRESPQDYLDEDAPYLVPRHTQSLRPCSEVYKRRLSASPRRIVVSPGFLSPEPQNSPTNRTVSLQAPLQATTGLMQRPLRAFDQNGGPTAMPSYEPTTGRTAISIPDLRSLLNSPIYLHHNAPIIPSPASLRDNPHLPHASSMRSHRVDRVEQPEPAITRVSPSTDRGVRRSSNRAPCPDQKEYANTTTQPSQQTPAEVIPSGLVPTIHSHTLPRTTFAGVRRMDQPHSIIIRSSTRSAPEPMEYVEPSPRPAQSPMALSPPVTAQGGNVPRLMHKTEGGDTSLHRARSSSRDHGSTVAASEKVAPRIAIPIASLPVTNGEVQHHPSPSARNIPQDQHPGAYSTSGLAQSHDRANLLPTSTSEILDVRSRLEVNDPRTPTAHQNQVARRVPSSQPRLARPPQTDSLAVGVTNNSKVGPSRSFKSPIIEWPPESRTTPTPGKNQQASGSVLVDHLTNNQELQNLIQLMQDDKRERQRAAAECEAHRAELERERVRARELELEIEATKRSIDELRQEREAKEMAHQASFNALKTSTKSIKVKINDIDVQMDTCRGARQTREEQRDREDIMDALYWDSSRRLDADILSTMETLVNGHHDAQKRRADRRAVLEEQEDIYRSIQNLREQNELQKRMIQDLMRDTAAQNMTQTSKLLTEFERASSKRVEVNVHDYLQEFSGALNHEVTILLGEVGNLREHRRNLQHEIGCLLCFRSKMEPGGEFDPAWDPLARHTCNHAQPEPHTRSPSHEVPPPFVRAQNTPTRDGTIRTSTGSIAVPPSFAGARPERRSALEQVERNPPAVNGMSLTSNLQLKPPALKPGHRKRDRKRK